MENELLTSVASGEKDDQVTELLSKDDDSDGENEVLGDLNDFQRLIFVSCL